MNTEELQQTFEKMWAEIRSFGLYAGQPSNWQSRMAVSIAEDAVRLATKAANVDLLLQAHDMLRYALTANEQSLEALPYYEQVIEGYEARGNLARASRVRIGYVEALLHSGRYNDAFSVAKVAEQWLKEMAKTKPTLACAPVSPTLIPVWINTSAPASTTRLPRKSSRA